ncbi:hypothetical protein V6582_07110 [Agrobacterium vitis]|uniref:hypothetical protein n=1 Tax=Agrobacterium vitis TaxID=373 RepID=UPI0012E8DA6F|nr:hypothetical protein [Agrobacterium vitis]MVA24808.1 hypothetical protein [Agrobacterium vitis]
MPHHGTVYAMMVAEELAVVLGIRMGSAFMLAQMRRPGFNEKLFDISSGAAAPSLTPQR